MMVNNPYKGIRMEEKILRVNRIDYTDKQVTGEMKYMDVNKEYFSCFTLELPDKNNERRVSCIPKGRYKWRKCAASSKFPYEHLDILNVPNRDGIKVHAANYHQQLLGCQAVGDSLTDINKDGYKDVTNSKATLKKLMAILPEEGWMVII